MTQPKETVFKDIVLVRRVKEPHGDTYRDVRPKAGADALRIIMNACEAGHTVSMRMDYDAQGQEIMNARIVWDA